VAVDDEGIVAAAGCADPSRAFPRPFRMLAVEEIRTAAPEAA
jgi:hypothetical protein